MFRMFGQNGKTRSKKKTKIEVIKNLFKKKHG